MRWSFTRCEAFRNLERFATTSALGYDEKFGLTFVRFEPSPRYVAVEKAPAIAEFQFYRDSEGAGLRTMAVLDCRKPVHAEYIVFRC